MRIKILFAGNFDVQNKALHFEKGDIADVSEADAERLVVGLCAEYADEPVYKTTMTDPAPFYAEDEPKHSKKRSKKEVEWQQDEQ